MATSATTSMIPAAAQPSTSHTTSLRFLQPPPALRNEVYERFVPCWKRVALIKRMRRTGVIKAEDILSILHTAVLNLMRSCHQMHQETASLLCGKVNFTFPYLTTMRTWLKKIDPNVAPIRHSIYFWTLAWCQVATGRHFDGRSYSM